MHTAIATNIRQNIRFTCGATAGLIVGLLVAWLGIGLCQEWFTAEAPQEGTVPLYVTPLAKIILGEQFSRGYPSVVVSLDEFRKQSANQPYIVSYSSALNDGTASMSDSRTIISYAMKRPDMDLYIAAYQRPPFFSVPVYELITKFNPQSKTFFSVIDGISYVRIFWGLVLALIGIIVSGVCAWMLIDLSRPRHVRFFR